MNRRKFIAGLFALPVAAVFAKVAIAEPPNSGLSIYDLRGSAKPLYPAEFWGKYKVPGRLIWNGHEVWRGEVDAS